ncbi:MAG TPA: restriction alleviation protein, Lar family [bacterium]|nr:restriction alleviation protein, Lar family [bacterium]
MPDELKPCPFCGGEAEAINVSDTTWKIGCKNCHIQFGHSWLGFAFKENAIKMWNRRSDAK